MPVSVSRADRKHAAGVGDGDRLRALARDRRISGSPGVDAALSSRVRRMDAERPMIEAASVRPEEMELMAITLRKRSRRRDSTRTGTLDEIAQSERAAMTALAETLRRAAAELPAESRLAVEFAKIARCIDVAGVLGNWGLDTLAREFAEEHDAKTAGAASLGVARALNTTSDAF